MWKATDIHQCACSTILSLLPSSTIQYHASIHKQAFANATIFPLSMLWRRENSATGSRAHPKVLFTVSSGSLKLNASCTFAKMSTRYEWQELCIGVLRQRVSCHDQSSKNLCVLTVFTVINAFCSMANNTVASRKVRIPQSHRTQRHLVDVIAFYVSSYPWRYSRCMKKTPFSIKNIIMTC